MLWYNANGYIVPTKLPTPRLLEAPKSSPTDSKAPKPSYPYLFLVIHS